MPFERSPLKPASQSRTQMISSLPEENSSNSDEELSPVYPSGKLGSITRKKNEMMSEMGVRNEESLKTIKDMYPELVKRIERFEEKCNFELNKGELLEEDKAEFKAWINGHMNEIFEFRSNLDHWIAGKTKEELSKTVVINKNTIDDKLSIDYSHRSSRSSNISATSSARFKLAEKIAKTAADKKVHLEEIKLEQEKLAIKEKEIELKLRKQEIEQEILVKGFNNLSDCNSKYSVKSEKEGKKTKVNRYEDTIPSIILKSNERALLPHHEPETFSGEDIAKFPSFIMEFKRTIEKHCINDTDKFYFLLKYTKDFPRQLVESCNQEDMSIGYQSAMKLLEERYGNKYKIANSYLIKLQNWPCIKNDDGKSLEDFSIYLTTCENMMRDIDSLNQLNSAKEIRNIVKILPYNMRIKWRDYASNIIDNGNKVYFKTLVSFINKQARIINHPLFGDIKDDSRLSKRNQRSDKQPEKYERKKIFNTSVSQKKKFPLCPVCNKENHCMDSCFFFKDKPYDERVDLIKRKKLCFGCLAEGHSSKQCENKIKCLKCKRDHPTSLHKDFTRKETLKEGVSEATEETKTANPSESGSVCVNTKTSFKNKATKVICAAVPVKIRINSGPIIETYMGIDNYNHNVFIDEELVEEANADGEPWNLRLTTMESKNKETPTKLIKNIEVFSLDGSEKEFISYAFSIKNWSFNWQDSPTSQDIVHFNHLKNLPIKYIQRKIGLLVGSNNNEISEPLKIVRSPVKGGAYGVLYKWGWAYNGSVPASNFRSKSNCFYSKSDEDDVHKKFEKMYSLDFEDYCDGKNGLSVEDGLWKTKVDLSCRRLSNNHFEIALPFKKNDIKMPYNFNQAFHRLKGLKRKFEGDENFFNEYRSFMRNMFENCFAEKIPGNEVDTETGKQWYINHHGVFHKQKNKIRVVFDCSAKFHGVSLNENLLQGPDLTNNLHRILIRFRQEKVAFSADVQKMYYQVKVPKNDADFLRFLWYEDDDYRKNVISCRLLVHVFGATSSPSCANYALKMCAGNPNISLVSKETIKNGFYVDDLLKSTETEDDAINIINEVLYALEMGGFNLLSFSSNSRTLMSKIAKEKHGKNFVGVDLEKDVLPNERALGMVWNTQNDTFNFIVKVKSYNDSVISKRRILSQLFSVYDPLGLVSPVIVYAKRIFQRACSLKVSWDQELPRDLTSQWNFWLNKIEFLHEYEVCRNYKDGMNNIKNIELHIFCDGSETAYGPVAYLRFEDSHNSVHCALVMAKTRLTPLNNSTLKTVPRIELNAAKLGVILQRKIVSEIELNPIKTYFWSDSQTVLKYIRSNSVRFQRFVSNRISYIRSRSNVEDWYYVPGKVNPADLLSRGIDAEKFLNMKIWKNGPEFLWKEKEFWPKEATIDSLNEENDIEVKKNKNIKVKNTKIENDHTMKLLNYSSDWFKTIRYVGWFLKFKEYLQINAKHTSLISMSKRMQSAEEIEVEIWKLIQKKNYSDVFRMIAKNNENLKRNHPLSKLNPILGIDKLLRVGGRISRSQESYEHKHPIIIPAKEPITKLLIKKIHIRIGHLGREFVLSALRRKYWATHATSLVKKVLHECIVCRKLNGRVCGQMMSSLPVDRLNSFLPPFTNTGIDFFGPFLVSRGRGKEKRYGVIFSCLTCRASHLEIAFSLDTDSFLCALRRFLSRRGMVKLIRSDNATNFIGAQRELRESIANWNKNKIEKFFHQENIEWKHQAPTASHFGGAWERQIRTVRKTMESMLNEQPIKLNDELLATLMCEIEYILNSRPITSVSDDPNDNFALTPNHLLLLNFEPQPPPGIFSRDDNYYRKRWKQVQYLADVFWRRWTREYLPTLQQRQKWFFPKRSLQRNDLVLVMDQLLPRNMWSIGRIVEVSTNEDNHVRVAKVKISKKGTNAFETKIMERPISKLILLKTVDELRT